MHINTSAVSSCVAFSWGMLIREQVSTRPCPVDQSNPLTGLAWTENAALAIPSENRALNTRVPFFISSLRIFADARIAPFLRPRPNARAGLRRCFVILIQSGNSAEFTHIVGDQRTALSYRMPCNRCVVLANDQACFGEFPLHLDRRVYRTLIPRQDLIQTFHKLINQRQIGSAHV